jgi:protein-S-isoprenylcysteine O-methyltransferase Ste14
MKQNRIVSFGDFVFKHRDVLPVPFIILAILILIFTKPTFTSFYERLILFTVGGMILVTGEAIRIWAVGYSGSTTRSKNLIADKLVTEGPYSIIRNPLYAGNFLITLGFALIANALIIVPIVIVYFIVEYYPIIRREEYFLSEKFGDAYTQYLKTVPCFFPKNFHIKKATYNSSALKGELWTIAGIVFMFAVMILVDLLRRKFV